MSDNDAGFDARACTRADLGFLEPQKGSQLKLRDRELLNRLFKASAHMAARWPKEIEYLNEVPVETDCMPHPNAGMAQLKVVRANSRYREGEMFYLKPAQLRLAYEPK